MSALSDANLLHIWEVGASLHAIDRALLILTVALPDWPREAVVTLPIGERNERLLAVQAQTFGAHMESQTACPSCSERLEFLLDSAAFLAAKQQSSEESGLTPPLEAGANAYQIEVEEYVLRYRLPDSRDLAAIAPLADVESARLALFSRCILLMLREGREISQEHLSERLIAQFMEALAAEIARRDPRAEILLDLDCPACQHHWQLAFDIVAFLWTEIVARGRRLLHEVDALARVYGWSEAEILALSPWRRQCYLELVT